MINERYEQGSIHPNQQPRPGRMAGTLRRSPARLNRTGPLGAPGRGGPHPRRLLPRQGPSLSSKRRCWPTPTTPDSKPPGSPPPGGFLGPKTRWHSFGRKQLATLSATIDTLRPRRSIRLRCRSKRWRWRPSTSASRAGLHVRGGRIPRCTATQGGQQILNLRSPTAYPPKQSAGGDWVVHTPRQSTQGITERAQSSSSGQGISSQVLTHWGTSSAVQVAASADDITHEVI